MDVLEKELYSKYGTSQIRQQDVEEILRDAAKRGLISVVDEIPTGPQDVSSLMECISKLRRDFLFDDCLGIGSESSPDAIPTDPNIIDKVLRAYFDYEKMVNIKKANKPRSKLKWFLLGSVSIAAGGFLYMHYVSPPY